MTDQERMNYWWRRSKAAESSLNKVLELHVKETGGTPTGDVADVCSCGMHYWPCPTVRAIEGAIND